jgi:hypothetical protein
MASTLETFGHAALTFANNNCLALSESTDGPGSMSIAYFCLYQTAAAAIAKTHEIRSNFFAAEALWVHVTDPRFDSMGDEDRLKLEKLLNSLEKGWVHSEVSSDAPWAKIEESLTVSCGIEAVAWQTRITY